MPENYNKDGCPLYEIPFIAGDLPYDSCSFWSLPLKVGWCTAVPVASSHSPSCTPPGTPPGTPPRTPPGLSTYSLPLRGHQEEYDEEYEAYKHSNHIPQPHLDEPEFLERRLAILQGWLFLSGLAELYRICGVEFSTDSAITTSTAGEKSVSTSILNRLPRTLIAKLDTLDPPSLQKSLAKLHRCISEITTVGCSTEACGFREWNKTSPRLARTGCKIFLSIRSLIRTTVPMIKHYAMWDTVDYITELICLDQVRSEDAGTYVVVEEMMDAANLCISDRMMLRIMRGVQDDGMFLASLLGRTGPRKYHSSCNLNQCLAYNTSEETYVTIHTTPGCNCGFVAVDSSQIAETLNQGQIPVINIVEKETPEGQELKLEVAHGCPYVAISHVWSDGLGNPYRNALPTCQIKRLHTLSQRTLDHTTKECAFWIDTLCVPVDPDLKALRSKAIGFFTETYKQAHRVLVLEENLQRSSPHSTLIEIGFRILCSVWMRRLWTLQEGVFGKERDSERLHFQLSDETFTWTQCLSLAAQATGDKPVFKNTAKKRSQLLDIAHAFCSHADLAYNVFAAIKGRIRPAWDPHSLPNPAETFIRIHDSMMYRITSKVSDEPICIASLLGLDVREIVRSSDTEGRMARLYVLLERIPVHFIFLDKPPRSLPQVGFRWAPYTLLGLNITGLTEECLVMEPSPPFGTCTPDGLRVVHSGYSLAFRGTKLGTTTITHKAASTGEEFRTTVVFLYAEAGEELTFMFHEYSLHQNVPEGMELALIKAPEIPALHSRAALMAVEKRDGDVMHARIVVMGMLARISKKNDGRSGRPWESVAKEEIEKGMQYDTLTPSKWTTVRTLPQDQRWCIT